MATSRSRKSKPMYLGFYGQGSTSAKNIKAQLDDLLDGVEEVTFLIPATKEDYTEAISNIVEYVDAANERDKGSIDLHAVVDATTPKKESTSGVAEDASETFKATNTVGDMVVSTIAAQIADGADGRLIMLWAGEEAGEEDFATFEEADNQDVAAYDLCAALELMEFSSGDEGDTAPDEAPTEEELEEKGLIELKEEGTKWGLDEATMKGKRKPGLIKMILDAAAVALADGSEGGEGEGEPEEPPARSRRSARTQEALDEDGDGDEQPDGEGQDDALASSVLDGLPDHVRLTPATTEALRVAVGDFVEALVTSIVVEVRKPKQAGKPRADGTSAVAKADQPKPARRERPKADPEEQREPQTTRRSRR